MCARPSAPRSSTSSCRTPGSAIPVYYLIATAEASSNLARYDGVRYGYRTRPHRQRPLREMYERTRDEGFGAEVKRRIMLGTYVLCAGYYDAYYLKAQQVRAKVRDDYTRRSSTCDVVATPTTPTPAFKLGEKTTDPLQMYLADIFTVSANLAGLPAVSLPCGVARAACRSAVSSPRGCGTRRRCSRPGRRCSTDRLACATARARYGAALSDDLAMLRSGDLIC